MDDFRSKNVCHLIKQVKDVTEEMSMELLRLDNALRTALEAKMGQRDVPQLDDKVFAKIYKILNPSDPVVWEGGKWWWYDETWADKNGPYNTRADAERGCNDSE